MSERFRPTTRLESEADAPPSPTHVSDFCALQIFGGSYPCLTCGRDFCLECFQLFPPANPLSSSSSSNGDRPPKKKARLEESSAIKATETGVLARLLRVSRSFVLVEETLLARADLSFSSPYPFLPSVEREQPTPSEILQPSLDSQSRNFAITSFPWQSFVVSRSSSLPFVALLPSRRDRLTTLQLNPTLSSVSKATLSTKASSETAQAIRLHLDEPELRLLVEDRRIYQTIVLSQILEFNSQKKSVYCTSAFGPSIDPVDPSKVPSHKFFVIVSRP